MEVTTSIRSAQTTSEQDQAKDEQEKARSAREQANANVLLFQLPAELRNKIYISALTHPSHGKFFISPYEWSSSIGPGVLRASRQIRAETLPLFYSQCRFTLLQEDLHFGHTWLQRLSADALALLRKLSCNVKVNFGSSGFGTPLHQAKVNIDRDSEGFRCSVMCGLEGCKKGTGKHPPLCPVAETICAQLTAMMRRVKVCRESTEYHREYLLALMKIVNKAQTMGIGFDDHRQVQLPDY